MTRTKRIAPVQRVVNNAEQSRAAQLALVQARCVEAQGKLVELERYHSDYARGFVQRATRGTGSAALRDYQVFLARLAEAVRQQQQVVVRVQQEVEQERMRWRQAATRARAVGELAVRWRAEEHREADRREQNDTDERAQRARSV